MNNKQLFDLTSPPLTEFETQFESVIALTQDCVRPLQDLS